MRFVRLVVFTLLAGPATAQNAFDISGTEACMQEAISFEERQYCVGASARNCMENLGEAADMAFCAGQEVEWWEARMNANLQDISGWPELSAAQRSALERMQAAWLAYRDESCAFQQIFGGGQGSQEAECRLWMTGDQAVYLEDYVPGY